MNIYMTFRHMEPTDAVRQYFQEKAEKLNKYMMKGERMNVIFSLEPHQKHRVDVTLFQKKHLFKSEETTTSMYASIDQVIHHLEQQLKKFKDKVKSHKNSLWVRRKVA